MEFNAGNECPRTYCLWTAYGLLSAAVGHGVFIDLKYFFIRCDTYIVLIGPSGGRKTAAMLQGLDILKEAIPDLPLSGDNETYQGILTYLDKTDAERPYSINGKPFLYKPYHIFAEELMDYLQLNPIAMVTFLTNIYGKRGYRYRLKNEERFLFNPYVTLCACSVPEWLTDQVKSKQFSEGYGRRTILVCHEGIVRRKPFMSPESIAARIRCVSRLREIHTLAGEVTLTPEADSFFWKWYQSQKDPDDLFLRNWYSTRHMNLLKVAMLTSVSEGNSLLVTLSHIELALELLKEVEKNLPMITSRMGRNEAMDSVVQMMNLIRSHSGQMLEKEVRIKTLNLFKDTREQWSNLETLVQTEQLFRVAKDGKTWLALPANVKKKEEPPK